MTIDYRPKTISSLAMTLLFLLCLTPARADMSGLVGYWSLDEGTGTMVNDSSQKGNTETLINAPAWTTGKVPIKDKGIGSALNFTAGDQSVSAKDQSVATIQANGSTNITGNQVTISDVDKSMMSEVENPHLVIPNANLQKDTVRIAHCTSYKDFLLTSISPSRQIPTSRSKNWQRSKRPGGGCSRRSRG